MYCKYCAHYHAIDLLHGICKIKRDIVLADEEKCGEFEDENDKGLR